MPRSPDVTPTERYKAAIQGVIKFLNLDETQKNILKDTHFSEFQDPSKVITKLNLYGMQTADGSLFPHIGPLLDLLKELAIQLTDAEWAQIQLEWQQEDTGAKKTLSKVPSQAAFEFPSFSATLKFLLLATLWVAGVGSIATLGAKLFGYFGYTYGINILQSTFLSRIGILALLGTAYTSVYVLGIVKLGEKNKDTPWEWSEFKTLGTVVLMYFAPITAPLISFFSESPLNTMKEDFTLYLGILGEGLLALVMPGLPSFGKGKGDEESHVTLSGKGGAHLGKGAGHFNKDDEGFRTGVSQQDSPGGPLQDITLNLGGSDGE